MRCSWRTVTATGASSFSMVLPENTCATGVLTGGDRKIRLHVAVAAAGVVARAAPLPLIARAEADAERAATLVAPAVGRRRAADPFRRPFKVVAAAPQIRTRARLHRHHRGSSRYRTASLAHAMD